MALQSIVSRNVDPLKNAVVSVCVVETDSTAYNVIPQTVRLKGTARSLDAEVRTQLEQGIARVAEGVAAAFGALHLPGEDGVLRLLERDGWTITAGGAS